ncbi:MAG: ATP-binding protein [Fusobacteriaceae bacterium]|jgi:predicted AAA+ superfamily ATPase|nr:ATP-binding protein [Fusobacteriaceae bacterium]
MKNRPVYLKKLSPFVNKHMIKVVTGIRRSGKSMLLDLFRAHLLESGVKEGQIIKHNFEEFRYDGMDHKTLYALIEEQTAEKGEKYYLLLDEIQRIPDWEITVNALFLSPDLDIYLTGSNAKLLSSEISTYLTGRYVEIKMLPLSFKEYLDFIDFAAGGDTARAFADYLEYGGFPGRIDIVETPRANMDFLSGVYNTILMKDVITRNIIKDPPLLENLMKYLADNIGNPVSAKKISDYLSSAGQKTSSETVENYLHHLEEAFIIYKASRYDLKGKLLLKTQAKYYLTDSGIRTLLLSDGSRDYGRLLENVVYFELLRRGYRVNVGKSDDLEIDFVAKNLDELIYCQVVASVMDPATLEREVRPLEKLNDNHEKVVLTMDRLPFKDYRGIKIRNILDFLLEEQA